MRNNKENFNCRDRKFHFLRISLFFELGLKSGPDGCILYYFGIPSTVSDSDFKDVFHRITNNASVSVRDNDINNCHHVGKLLSRLLEEKKANFSFQKDLNKIIMDNIRLEGGKKI